MRPRPITVVALVAVLGLAGGIVATAITGASGAPAQSFLVHPIPAARVTVAGPPCSFASPAAAGGIRVGGVCDGALTGAPTCAERAKLLALSFDRPFGRRGQAFHLTIVVSNSSGQGGQSQAGAVAQIGGLGNVSRWSNRELSVVVGPSGSVELQPSTLLPEAGTPATGRLTLSGRATCASK